ncbi:uncharacterized protein LOC117295401 [Asterias rubens]|uniref:uncharacterized protein LOC117295401 n=1 Tax=Asterias rubens TaxID=7604 RepID=UPI0014551D63|nr:uncharacterized protein LOC117295401 [Asterias rubens]
MVSTSQIYSFDCKLMPQGKETILGRETIPKGLRDLRDKGGSSVEWNTLEIGPMDGNGDVIFERGEYKFSNPDGPVCEGKHLVIWKKVSGVYEMYIDIYNENK